MPRQAHHNIRSSETVNKQVKQEGAESKIRICLRCDCDFISDGLGNRICPKCKHNGANVPDPAEVRGKIHTL